MPADPALRPFRPHLARIVAWALVVLVLAATGVLVALMPDLTALDRTGFVLLGLLIAWFCWRQASVAAVPDERGLTVRNLLVTTHLQWEQIVSVRFGDRPWVQLDLADGDTLAVMGVQRADGERANAEARRLATLVAARSRGLPDD
ncbi:PH domain-containing protein [Cellulomonas sp. DKR-3]|uniref:PH domain-containing protein n=1 Tax=Cellulomonas fulva TaxID=2835530 RepID=A0ABS5U1D4_9CELL|nr:PH domain-containing protein [Cellulomonas fulva]MBT0995157.1 PH domain-containing protein [Cellulomonas fulva]